MALTWHAEQPAHWDDAKQRILGAEPPGTFGDTLLPTHPGAVLPGDWFRVDRDGVAVGYAWMDTVWGDAEILLSVAPDARTTGIGAFALDHLDHEAATRGLNYLFNRVSPRHPRGAEVSGWLQRQGFHASGDGRWLRRRVRG
ncbi:MAG: GNAT family N-acetyltransferase [Alphaproteobacteria bacterium]|nr:GNAT family N-acetyltransferase [Alphaproteobacteria bacterium]